MARNSAATRARLLEAAYTEFAECGLAGARIDRIAAAAGSNKQGIYAYFGSKQALFDEVMTHRLGGMADAVPFTVEDLPGFAASLFDYLAQNPDLLRLARWKLLEQRETWTEEFAAYAPKIAAIADTYRFPADIDPPAAAAELFTQILGTVAVTVSRSPALAAYDAGPPAAAHERQRAVVAASTRAIVNALTVT